MHRLLAQARGLHDSRRNSEVLALLDQLDRDRCMPLEDEAMFRCLVGSSAWKLDQMLLAHEQFFTAYGMLADVKNPEYGCSIEICESFRLSEMGFHLEAESMLAGAYCKYDMPDALRAHLLRNWGREAHELNRREHCVDLLSRSIAIYERLGDLNGLVGASTDLARHYIMMKDWLAGERILTPMVSVIHNVGLRTQARFWRCLAEAYLGLRQVSLAVVATNRALTLADMLKLDSELSLVYGLFARVMQDVDPIRAREYSEKALHYGLSARNGALVASAMGML